MKDIRFLLTALVMTTVIAAGCGGEALTPTLTMDDAIATVEASVKATATALAQPLPTRTATPKPTRTPIPSNHQQILLRAQQATVYIEIPDDRGRIAGSGSGAIVQENGLILTNWHLTSDSDGTQFNREGLVFVGVTKDPKVAPPLDYRAVVVAYDRYLRLDRHLRQLPHPGHRPLQPPHMSRSKSQCRQSLLGITLACESRVAIWSR